MALLKMTFTLDEEIIRQVAYDKDVKPGEPAIPMLEIMSVELATMLVSVSRREEAKTPLEPQPGGHHPYN